MMNEHWTDRLSEYLDGEMEAKDIAALEAHVTTCAACRVTLDELRRVVSLAAALDDSEPPRDLWPGILETIRAGDDVAVLPFRGAEPTRRRFAFTAPQLAAAATVLMLLSGGTVWTLSRQAMPSPSPVAVESPLPESPAASAAQFVSATELSYDAAIRALEDQLAIRRADLDSETIAIVERSLATIDAAITDARAALSRDPSNAYLYRHLDNTIMKKIDLLRRATSLPRAEM